MIVFMPVQICANIIPIPTTKGIIIHFLKINFSLFSELLLIVCLISSTSFSASIVGSIFLNTFLAYSSLFLLTSQRGVSLIKLNPTSNTNPGRIPANNIQRQLYIAFANAAFIKYENKIPAVIAH